MDAMTYTLKLGREKTGGTNPTPKLLPFCVKCYELF